MAIIYVNSVGGSNTSPYDTWAKGATAKQTALTAWADGDEIWVAHDHTEGTATITWTAVNDTNANRIPIYRVNSSTNVYSPSTGSDTKQYDASTAGADVNINISGSIHGEYFYADDNIQLAGGTDDTLNCEDCQFELATANSQLLFGSANSNNTARLKGGAVNFTHATGGYLYVNSGVVLVGVNFPGYGQTDGVLRPQNASRPCNVNAIGCDFTNLLSSTSLPLIEITGTCEQKWNLIACAIKSGQTIHNSGFANDNQYIYVHNTDSAGNTYVTSRHGFRGDVQQDTTVYYGGTDAYVDADGSTPLSHGMTIAANVDQASPLTSLDMLARIDSTGSKTFTIEIVENFTSALTQRDCWIEVFYLGGASSTLWSLGDSGREVVATSYTNLAAGSGLTDWTGEPAGSRSEKVTATATVSKTGVYMVRLHMASYEAGKEFYYNPKVTVA